MFKGEMGGMGEPTNSAEDTHPWYLTSLSRALDDYGVAIGCHNSHSARLFFVFLNMELFQLHQVSESARAAVYHSTALGTRSQQGGCSAISLQQRFRPRAIWVRTQDVRRR